MDGAEPDGTREDFPNEKTMESGRSTEKWTRTLRGDPREGSAKQPKSPSGKVRATSGLRGLLSSPHVRVKKHRAFGNPDTRATVGADGPGSTCLRRPSAGKVEKARELRGGKSMDRRAEAYRKESA
jgi:hypothetical protein